MDDHFNDIDIIDKELKIIEGKESAFAMVHLMKGIKIAGGVILGFCLLFTFMGAPFFLYKMLLPMLIIVFGLVFIIQYFSQKSIAKAWRIIIDEDGIQRLHDQNSLSRKDKVSVQVAEARHGIQASVFIAFENVASMKKQQNGYSIKSTSHNFFNGNGEIFLFEGYEHYDEAVELIKNNLPKKLIFD